MVPVHQLLVPCQVSLSLMRIGCSVRILGRHLPQRRHFVTNSGNTVTLATSMLVWLFAGAADALLSSTPGATAATAAFSGRVAGVVGRVAPSSGALLAQIRARQQATTPGAAAAAMAHPFAAPSRTTTAAAAAGLSVASGAGVIAGGTSSLVPGGSTSAGGAGVGASASASVAGTQSAAQLERASFLAASIVSFLESVGGEAPSEEVVGHFSNSVTPREMPLFKQVLKQVAVLQRPRRGSRSSGNSDRVWVVRPEYQDHTAV